MKILDLRIENIGKIKLFELNTHGENVVIGGRNGQGKTTVLRAIEMLLAGKKAFPDKPVREGQDEGLIRAELEGGYFVERRVNENGNTVVVIKNTAGAKFSSPQAMLDDFRGANMLDPLQFLNLKPKEQLDKVKELVGLDFDELDRKRTKAYEDRTHIGRQLGDVEGKLKDRKPDTEALEHTDATDALLERLREVQELTRISGRQAEIKTRMAQLQAEYNQLEIEYGANEDTLTNNEYREGEYEEVQNAIREEKTWAERKNAELRYADLQADIDTLTGKREELTAIIKTIDAEKLEALSNVKFPVDGLSFDGTELLLNKIPFSQASAAERLRVSTAMAFASQPKLKVVLIRDASLLDDHNLELIKQTALQYGGHVWLERVGDGEECTVVLEDGEIIKPAPNTDGELVDADFDEVE